MDPRAFKCLKFVCHSLRKKPAGLASFKVNSCKSKIVGYEGLLLCIFIAIFLFLSVKKSFCLFLVNGFDAYQS